MKALYPSVLIALAMMTPRLACSEPLDAAAINGPAQRYVIMLPEAPVGDLAQEVLGETLGLPVTVDERVASRMAFRVDGLYSPKELAREFGYRLWNVDAVLIEDPAEGLLIIPAAALPGVIRDGGQVVSPLALQTPPAAATRAGPRTPITYGNRRWREDNLAYVAVGVMGWLAGLGSFAGLTWLRRRYRSRGMSDTGVLRLAAPFEESGSGAGSAATAALEDDHLELRPEKTAHRIPSS